MSLPISLLVKYKLNALQMPSKYNVNLQKEITRNEMTHIKNQMQISRSSDADTILIN